MVARVGISAGLKMVDTESTTPGMREEKLQHSTSAAAVTLVFLGWRLRRVEF